jgi:hypothetical protein
MYEYRLLPRARQDGLLEEAVGEELLLYDQESHIAHCLSPIAAYVWRHCDGERDLTDLAALAGASEDLVADALRELREKDLLDAEPTPIEGTVPGESRREAIVRVGRYGVAAAAVPLVVSATAATPAMAATMCKSDPDTGCCVCEKCCKEASTKGKCETECNESATRGKYENFTPSMVCISLTC